MNNVYSSLQAWRRQYRKRYNAWKQLKDDVHWQKLVMFEWMIWVRSNSIDDFKNERNYTINFGLYSTRAIANKRIIETNS